ncbi:retrovirus-related pol polyprotein from transposon TNT 1-94 [Tanacetum coccineum]
MGSNEETNAAGTDTRPQCWLESDFDSWKIRIPEHGYLQPPYVQIYTHLKAYEPHAKKTLKKQEQATSLVDPLAYVAHTTSAPALLSPLTPSPQPTAQTLNDALMATMTQINLLSGFQKQFPPTNNISGLPPTPRTQCYGMMVTVFTEPVQRKLYASSERKPIEKGRTVLVLQNKALLMEAKEKGDVIDAEARGIAGARGRGGGTGMKAPMLLSLSWPTCIPLDMHHEEHLVSDAETEIDDNTIPYHQYPQGQTVSLNKVRQEQALVIQRNKRNAELVQENDLLKSTLSGKEKSIAFLQSEKEKILSEKKDLADSYLDEIVCLKNANKVARDMLQRFNMPTQTIPMLSKKPKRATKDLHKDILGTRNPGLGYMAKRAQPVLYDADTLLHPNHHPVSIWDSEEVLVHQVVSMKKMNEKPGHVRPENGFYEKLNALKFVPQKELSGDQAYWLSANEIASQASKSATPATPFVRKSRPPSQVLASLRNVNAVFPQFEGIIKERTTQRPDYVSEWCFDYAKQFVEQQLVPFYDHFKKHIQAANDTFFKEVREFEQIFDDLEAEYEQCVLDNKNLTIEKKNLLIKHDCLIAECLEKDICSIVLTSASEIVPKLKLDGLKVENEDLAKRTVKTSSGPSPLTPPKRCLLQGMYNLGVKPTSGASKIVPKRTPRNHSSLPVKSANARRVEDHHRTLNKKNRVDSNLLVKYYVSVSKLNNVCAACNKSLVIANHTDCLVMCDGSVNVKPHQTKRFKRQPKKEWKPIKRVWKPISKPVANSKPQWKPTGRHFSLFEKYPLTRIMEPTDMPIELPPSASSSPQITMVSRFTDHKLSDRQAGSTVCSMVSGFLRMLKIHDEVIVLSYQLCRKFIGTVRFGNDEYAAIIGYGDYKLGDTIISRVYYVEGLKHNLFSVRTFVWLHQFAYLQKPLPRSHGYGIVGYFGTLNELARKNLVRGLPMLKYDKDHLCPSCQLGKSKKASHPLKTANTNTEVLHTLIWTLLGPMRTESINGEETNEALNATVRFVRTDNGTEVCKYDFDGWFESVVIAHETSRTSVSTTETALSERRIRTVSMEACSYYAHLCESSTVFLWAEACRPLVFYSNRSLDNTFTEKKTYYELLKGKKPNLQYFRVFGSLCYPTNDYDDVGKLKAKADIGIFVGYAPTKKAYRIYNKRTRKIQETVHVAFDELTEGLTSVQTSSGLAPQHMTSVPNK